MSTADRLEAGSHDLEPDVVMAKTPHRGGGIHARLHGSDLA